MNNTIVVKYINTKVVCTDNTSVLDSCAMILKYGDRLRLARERKGLTQNELAKLTSVKQGTISKIERGDQEYSSFDIPLAQVLDISPIWLKNGNANYTPEWLSLNEPTENTIKEESTSYKTSSNSILDGLTKEQAQDILNKIHTYREQNEAVLTELSNDRKTKYRIDRD